MIPKACPRRQRVGTGFRIRSCAKGKKYNARRGRQIALAPDRRAEVGRASPDRRPAARVAVQYPRRTPMAIRSAARACSTCSPAPARSASRRFRAARLTRCSSTTACRRARCCATMSSRSASAASRAFSAAMPRSLGRRIRSSRSRSPSSIRPIARAWPKRRWPPRATAAGLSPARWWWWRKRRTPVSKRRRDSRNWSGANTTIRSWCSLRHA